MVGGGFVLKMNEMCPNMSEMSPNVSKSGQISSKMGENQPKVSKSDENGLILPKKRCFGMKMSIFA